MLEPFMCQIPLKAIEKPLNEEQVQRMKKFMVDEYAVRYLEKIGATPTPANLRAVKKEIPLQRFKLTAAFKSRGGLEDMFYLSNVEPENPSRHLWREHAARSLFADMVDRKLSGTAAAEPDEPASTAPPKDALALDASAAHSKHVPRFALQSAAPAHKPPPLSMNRADDMESKIAFARLGTSPQNTTRSQRSRRARRRSVHTPPASDGTSLSGLRAQQRQQLNVTLDDVLALQTLFVRTFPMDELRARLAPEDFAMLLGELTSVALAKLIHMVARVVEWASQGEEGASVLPHPLDPSPEEAACGARVSAALEALLLAIFSDWVEMQGRVARHQTAVLAFPVYLMLVRVGVETVLRNALPALSRSLEGQAALLARIGRVVTSLLDPDGYLNFPPPAPPGRAFIAGLAPARPRAAAADAPLDGLPRAALPWATLSGAAARGHHVSSKFWTVSPLVKNLFAVAAAPQLHRMRHRIERTTHHAAPPRGSRAAARAKPLSPGSPAARRAVKNEPLPLLATDGEDPLAAVLSLENVNRIYLLALRKRQQRLDQAERRRAKLQGLRLTQEEREDEALHLMLPHGAEHLGGPQRH